MRRIALAGAVAGVAFGLGTACGQPDTDAVINITGMELRCQIFGPCFPDQSRNSQAHPFPPGTPQFIVPASGYSFEIDGIVETTGLVGLVIPNNSTIAEMMEIIEPGASRLLRGHSRNLLGGLPLSKNGVFAQTFVGEAAGIELSITIDTWLRNDGAAFFEIRDIDIPLGILFGTVKVKSGTTAVEVWEASARQETEWHFEGDLGSVSGSGPSMLRYLDDPSFGTILGGIGNEDNPDPTIPTGVTEQQSFFATTTALGIAGPGGKDDTVYVTSPARNLTDTDPKNYRGIGLALYPRTQPAFPGTWFGQWTMVWDMYIPHETWNNHEWVAALVHGNHNNNGGADMFIRNPAFGGGGVIGFDRQPGQYLNTPLIKPGEWFRLAFVCDHMQGGVGRVYVNGQLVGSTGSDWLYDSVDPGDPRYGDGEAVDPADWQAWGEFPSPWARSSGTEPGSVGPTPLASTFCLFADLGSAEFGPGGRSEVVYVSSMYFADDVLSGAEIAALGGPDGDGIVFKKGPGCPADFNGDTVVNTLDFVAFLNAFVGGDPKADFNGDTVVNTLDFVAFLNAFVAGCP
ncbi:MAG TPA: GC-type dockerin domain-anchored protein [Phycisphaerales bacterium]|nr:GC-type dockerin domain-anchored protein [Phycisphaerales bacterium]